MAKKINVGLVGYAFMGKAHSHAYKDLPLYYPELELQPVMKAICGRNAEKVTGAAQAFGWESVETNFKKLLRRDDIDLVDISTPGNQHYPMALAAAEAGKVVFCEKPLANNLDEAKAMLKAVEKAKVKHAVCFNYRKSPAVGLAKQILTEGTLGKIYHFRATYLQDWIADPSFPLVWRLQKKISGSGVLGDLGAHIVDLAHFLVGDIAAVSAALETFIKERPVMAEVADGLGAKASKKMGKVDVDDAAIFLAKFKNGALGTFEATRFAQGRKNFNRFEINGSKGSLVFNLERLNELELYLADDPEYARGFRTILVTEMSGVHPYAGHFWPPGHISGYADTFVNMVADILQALAKGKMPSPNFVDGVKCQTVLDAVERSAKSGAWIRI